MEMYYPGAEDACDGCPDQLADDESLVCAVFSAPIIYFYPACMRERA
jgi:hypothetical protein